ncbi:DUF2326 domain-containing protein [Microbulbifer sp. ZKSA002]|uniref:DUF2326 domain-containing protein n=1 Tax=Microbulbifer sp. ZKSA002 TaxID=3243388 RepID=UPI0040391755
MQLIKLIVYKNNKILREVNFKKGLNLIINSDSSQSKSGNSVGKSTLSRIIDYIFLSSGEDIYTEQEFKKAIPEVSQFINENEVIAELTFIGFDKNRYSVARSLKTKPQKSNYLINNEAVEKKEYTKIITSQIFGLNSEKPSIRSLSHKFIRNTHEKMQNTTKFLHGNTKPDVYDQLYLFLFGFSGLSLLKEKGELNNKISTKKKHLAAYRNPHRESVLVKMIKPLEKEEAQLKNRISLFDFKDAQEKDVKELVKIQSEISDLTIEYSSATNKVNYLRKSIEKLKGSATNVNGKELSEIYSDAGVSVSEDLKRSYEELVIFHNKILTNKIKIIEKELHSSIEKLDQFKSDINLLQESESSIFRGIREPSALKSIGQMYNDLSTVREEMGKVQVLLEKIEETKKSITTLELRKTEVVDEIYNNRETLDRNVEVFNGYFGDLSKSFYDERYIFDLIFDAEKEKCEFNIACVTPNSTGGKKKGELSAFDMAYINFIRRNKLKRPTFVIHDSIEDVDINQVYSIFKSSEKIEGQYIVSVLNDKISGEKFKAFKDHSVILELSEDDKFFKI